MGLWHCHHVGGNDAPINETIEMTTTAPTITAGSKLTARSICDAECIFTATVLDRRGSFAVVRCQGNEKRVKVRRDDRGEYVFAAGQFSMAPLFRPETVRA